MHFCLISWRRSKTLDFTHLALDYKPFPPIEPGRWTLPLLDPLEFFIVQCDDSDSLDSGGSRRFSLIWIWVLPRGLNTYVSGSGSPQIPVDQKLPDGDSSPQYLFEKGS